MIYSKNSKTVIDVTKAPYFCDNTGTADCTEALCRAFDDILRPNIEGIQKAVEKLNASDDPNYTLSFEICKQNNILQVIFPEDLEPAKILYFPNGTYLISDTVSHSLENLKNILQGKYTMEMNRQIYFRGESRENTVIKLEDKCKGFEFGKKKPMISYMRTEQSNIAMTNSFIDLTLDCGIGNPGAIGLEFYSNNSGAVRNVTIKSSDPEYKGYCGIYSIRPMECYMKNIEVIGFDYGMRIEKTKAPVVVENIDLRDQREAGIFGVDSNVATLNLKSNNNVDAFKVSGYASQTALINADIKTESNTAVIIGDGGAYLRNVKTEGAEWPLILGIHSYNKDKFIKEYATRHYNVLNSDIYPLGMNIEHGPDYDFNEREPLSLNLPIEDTPESYMISDEMDIAFVDGFGAIGNGKIDCTDAIEKALNSGKPVVHFGSGHYLIDRPVKVPATVKLIDFMYCDFYAGENIKNAVGEGVFVIDEDSDTPITMQNVFAWEKFYGMFRFIRHNSTRTLILKDMHTQCSGMYFNTVEGGKVFIENVACTMGGGDYCTVSPFEFIGQKVWARQINPERGDVQILNDHSDLWILGMKTESRMRRFASIAVKTINGGKTECFGATSGIGSNGIPLYINDNSSMSAYFSFSGSERNTTWDIAVRETQGNVTKEISIDDTEQIARVGFRVTGYIGKKK